MKATAGFLVILACAFASAAALAAPAAAKCALIADVASVAPGGHFRVGVHFTLKPGWHIYWKNAGDSGLPTIVKLKLPDGFTAGPLRYPTPEKFAQPENVTAQGYEGEVILYFDIVAPKDLAAGAKIDFSAEVSWLCCDKECIPGDASPTLQIVAGEAKPSEQADAFKKAAASVPAMAAKDSDAAAAITRKPNPEGVMVYSVTLNWKEGMPAPADLNCFIDAPAAISVEHVEVKAAGGMHFLTITTRLLKGQENTADAMECVLGYKDKDGQRRGLLVMLKLK